MKTAVPFVDLSRQHEEIREELEPRMLELVRKGDYILGNQVVRFEQLFAKATGSQAAIGVANGTDGLLLALRALDIQPGDEVITVSHTFIATALAITYAGAKPVFVDISPLTLNMDPRLLEAAITKRTRAILPVCLYGQAPELDIIATIAKKHKLKVILDACQAHGALYKSRPLMDFADAVVYSFYPTKNLGAYGDGGAITVQSAKLAEKLTVLRNVGRTGWYEHPVKGYNSRLDALQAVILQVKLKKLSAWNRLRREKAAWYNRQLEALPVTIPFENPNGQHVYYLYVIQTDHREELKQYLTDHGIHSAIHYPIPVHLQKAYRELNQPKNSLPITERTAKRILSLPFFPHITESEQKKVVAAITSFYSGRKKS